MSDQEVATHWSNVVIALHYNSEMEAPKIVDWMIEELDFSISRTEVNRMLYKTVSPEGLEREKVFSHDDGYPRKKWKLTQEWVDKLQTMAKQPDEKSGKNLLPVPFCALCDSITIYHHARQTYTCSRKDCGAYDSSNRMRKPTKKLPNARVKNISDSIINASIRNSMGRGNWTPKVGYKHWKKPE